MYSIRVIFIVGLWMCLARADEKKIEEDKAARLVLTSFLESLRNGESEKFYRFHTSEGQKLLLADEFLRISITASGDDEAAQAAKEILKNHFKKNEAVKEIAESKVPLTNQERELVCLRHIAQPEQMYKECMAFKEKYDEKNRLRDWRKSIATAEDFDLIATEKTISASGNKNRHTKVEFTKEQDGWKVACNWSVSLAAP